MTTKPGLSSEERIFATADVKRLYIAKRRLILKWACFGAIFTFLICALFQPKYKAEATFKEGVQKREYEGSFLGILGGLSVSNDPQALVLMKSFQVLKPLIVHLGLQAEVVRTRWDFGVRMQENLHAELGAPLEDLDPFVFRDVSYEGEKARPFFFRFAGADLFTVYDDQKNILGEMRQGEPFHLPGITWTLVNSPKTVKPGNFYPLCIKPWVPIAENLRNELKATTDSYNRFVYHLTFCHRDRHLAVRVLNELMDQYQCFIRKEEDQIAQEQLAYLAKRQDEIYADLSHLLKTQVDYLNHNLSENGYLGLKDESESWRMSYKNMQDRLLQIDIELSRLDKTDPKGGLFALQDGACPQGLMEVAKTIQELKQERDLLELTQAPPLNSDVLAIRKEQLQKIRAQRVEIGKWMAQESLGQEIACLDLTSRGAHFSYEMQNPDERKDRLEFLESYARQLRVRESVLQESLFYGNETPSEWEGIDLETAKELFIQYNNLLDTAQGNERRISLLKVELQKPDFAIDSLGAVLSDSLSKKLIDEASQIAIRLKDEKYHSSKEEERWERELALQKKILSDHLEQLDQVEKLNVALIQEKMKALQGVSLDCINRQISVQYARGSDLLKEWRGLLSQEKGILEKKMEEVRGFFTQFPEKWQKEKWLDLKTDIGTKMASALAELVESKTIGHHLRAAESKPLDQANVPFQPQPPRLLLSSLLGSFLFGFVAFLFTLIHHILKGFPVSSDTLKALGLPVLGSLSPSCDGPDFKLNESDLDLLRRLSLFALKTKVIGLFANFGPDFTYALGENLARTSKTSIVLRCDFATASDDASGLLQFCTQKSAEINIRKGNGFDYILAGGRSLFGTEIIQSPQFLKLLESLKPQYDFIFLLFRSSLSSAESKAALNLCDQAVVMTFQERTEELTPFVTWGYHTDSCRITFITGT